jgi:hypothetical protein
MKRPDSILSEAETIVNGERNRDYSTAWDSFSILFKSYKSKTSIL